MEHAFTPKIMEVLKDEFGQDAERIFEKSPLLQYLNIKTKSANKGAKSRSSFANHYAIYVLAEDYIEGGFVDSNTYDKYGGAKFSTLFARQRQLPFGSKLQNHALNHRMNQEFKKYFPTCDHIPILRDASTSRYWINESLLNVDVGNDRIRNVARSVVGIIDAYVDAKRDSFEGFMKTCEKMRTINKGDTDSVKTFLGDLVAPNADARIFEIVSYAILKEHFAGQSMFWGWTRDELVEEILVLYKTGRCNANDGGVDFVMRPLGRFFQVTETTDVKKYFLDIDKVQRYPITFVVKSNEPAKEIEEKIRSQAKKQYGVDKIVARYMDCVEEIINIPDLMLRFKRLADADCLRPVLEEVIRQSKVEFNIE